MLSKILVFIFAVIALVIAGFFGLIYFGINRAIDENAKIFAVQALSQVTQNWDKDKLNNYLDYEYSVGWVEQLRDDLPKVRKQKSDDKDVGILLSQAKDSLGSLKSIKGTNCINFSDQISCFSAVEFENGEAMLALSLRPVSADKNQYKINTFVIERPNSK